MSAAPLFMLGCCFTGMLSGAFFGARHSATAMIGGGVLGFFLGIASFLCLVIPWVVVTIKFERWPRIWNALQLVTFFVMIGSVVVSGILTWYLMGMVLQ